jgi:hypothetical protein
MNRVVTYDDLDLLSQKARSLAELAQSAQGIRGDLGAGKQDIKTLHDLIEHDEKRLQRAGLTKKQRGKTGRRLEYHDETLYYTQRAVKKNARKFSRAMLRIESALRELTASHEELANVHRFEAG